MAPLLRNSQKTTHLAFRAQFSLLEAPVWQRHVVYRNGWCFNAETAWIKAMLYLSINILHSSAPNYFCGIEKLRIFCVRSQTRIVAAIQWSGEICFFPENGSKFKLNPWQAHVKQIPSQGGLIKSSKTSEKLKLETMEKFILDSLIWGRLLQDAGVVWCLYCSVSVSVSWTNF